jgi:tRNA threonylcarbamoyladenosine biosynthesis protein TsaB
MTPILCIESGTSTCSVALGYNDILIDIEESHDPNNNHAKNLTHFVEVMLKRQGLKASDLSAVAVSKGPGSYTGLRIGVSAAKGICYGANIPLIAVGSLDSMAQGALQIIASNTNKPEVLCPMIDARRMEVYTQMFNREGEPISSVEAKVLDNNSFNEILEEKTILFFGNGAQKAKDEILHPNALFIFDFKPSARFMIPFANRLLNQRKYEDAAYFEPLYLKDFVATVAKNKIFGRK